MQIYLAFVIVSSYNELPLSFLIHLNQWICDWFKNRI